LVIHGLLVVLSFPTTSAAAYGSLLSQGRHLQGG
jgi:hypothetical protein